MSRSEWIDINLGSTIEFRNGKSSPPRNENRPNPVFGGNGIMGFTDEYNSDIETVIVGRVGAYCGSVYYHKGNCWVTDNAIIGKVREQCDGLFLYYLLKSIGLNNYSTGSSQPLVNQSNLNSINVRLPKEKQTQTRIASILSALDDKIELNRQTSATLEAIAQAIFKEWFVDFNFPCATGAMVESELGMIPRGWKVRKLRDVVDVIDCLHSKKPERALEKTGFILLQLGNILDSGLLDLGDTYWISEQNYKTWISRIEAKEGVIVITNVGRVGAIARIPKGVRAAMGRNMTALSTKKSFMFDVFLILLLKSQAMRNEIELKTDAGTILDSLNVRNIPLLRFVCPPIEMLEKFEKAIKPSWEKMEENIQQSQTLAAIRDALLPKLMSGVIEV